MHPSLRPPPLPTYHASTEGSHFGFKPLSLGSGARHCYASQQTYIEVNDTYSEGGTHEETLRPQRKAKVMNKRRGN